MLRFRGSLRYWAQGLETLVPDMSTMVLLKPPITSPVKVELSMELMVLFGARMMPTPVVGTMVVTVAAGLVMLNTTSRGPTLP